jgi:hypothetical protein
MSHVIELILAAALSFTGCGKRPMSAGRHDPHAVEKKRRTCLKTSCPGTENPKASANRNARHAAFRGHKTRGGRL